MNFRKRNVKNVEQLVAVINEHLAKVNSAHASTPAPKQAALEDAVTEPTKLSVFNRSFDVALPFTGEKKFAGYDISVGGKKLLNIKPQNGQPMTKAQLEWAVKRELVSGYKQAKLTSRIAMLSEGSKVYIVASDKTKKMVKIASFEHNVRAWVPESKIKLIALESQTVQFNGQSCKVLGQTASETLLDCTETGPVWVSSTELMDDNRPPATPEALNDTEALQTAIPQSIQDQDAYLNNPPVDKEAAGCDSCAASIINGVFCHETGCPNAPKKCRHGKRSDVCSVCSDPLEGEGSEVEGSLSKLARVVHQKNGWHVLSEEGKNLGGPYGSKEEAVKRLRQVEYFKHHGSLRPFSKKAEVMADPYQSLTTHVENMRSRMNQVQDRLQSNPLPKQADADMVSGDMTPAQILEDIEMGLALLENKIMDNDVDSEINPAIEEMETLLASVENELGMGEKSLEVKKEAALPVAIAPTLSNPAPATNNSATPIVPDDKKTSCALCGGMTFNDFDSYQNHMQFTHASDTMPTSPSQKLQPTNVKSEKIADVVTDETVTTNDPNAAIDPTVPAIPTIKNVQPTDDHNLEDPTQMPTSPLPAGQKWQWNGMIGKYVAMTDPSNISKAI
jgi:hypothetical protein